MGPISETDDVISTLLREQGVIESFKSRINTEYNTASCIFKFTTHRPHSIVLNYRSFPVGNPPIVQSAWTLAIQPTGAPALPVVKSVRKTMTNPLNANPHQNALTVLICGTNCFSSCWQLVYVSAMSHFKLLKPCIPKCQGLCYETRIRHRKTHETSVF